MLKKKSVWIILIIVVVSMMLFYLLFIKPLFNAGIDANEKSKAASIIGCADYSVTVKGRESYIYRLFAKMPADTMPYRLNDDEYKTLMKDLYSIDRQYGTEAFIKWDTSKTLKDLWGMKYNITLVKRDTTVAMSVASSGRDRKMGTSDDVISSYDLGCLFDKDILDKKAKHHSQK